RSLKLQPFPYTTLFRSIKMFAGTWTASQKIEPSEFMPGGSGTGTDTVKAGPGGNSLLSDYRSKSAMGSFSGHGIIYWEPKRQVRSEEHTSELQSHLNLV